MVLKEPLLTIRMIRFNDPVRIEVGSGDSIETFTTDSEFLTSRSLFFKKALSGSFKEAQDRVVKLPSDSPGVFGVYLHLLHTQELSVLPEKLPIDYVRVEEKVLLARLYVLAEKFQDIKSKNTIIKALIASSYEPWLDSSQAWLPSIMTITLIYKGTTPGSMAPKFLVDTMACDNSDTKSILSEAWPNDFLSELAHEFMVHRYDKCEKKLQGKWAMRHPEEYMEKETEE